MICDKLIEGIVYLKGKGTGAWADRTGTDVLGNRGAFQLFGQHADLPGIFDYCRNTGIYGRNCNHRWNRIRENADCDFLRRRIHGRKHLYWKCAEFHGKIHFRRKRYPDAFLFRVYPMVHPVFDSGISH